MVRTLEFYGYDDSAFMTAVNRNCPGCHFDIKVDEDGIIHLVNGELSTKIDIVYDKLTGTICLYDLVADEIIASGINAADLFEEVTSGQTFITSAITTESGITFFTSDVMGGETSEIDLPLPTLSIIGGAGIEVTPTESGTVISLDVEVIDILDELLAFSAETMSGVSGIIETVEELVETSEAHTEAIEALSADTETISGNVDNLIESAETLTQEVTDLQAADVALSGAIDDVKTAHTADITTLSNRIDDEITARTAADGVLQDNIDAEATARTAADNALSGAVDTEKQEREDADEALSDTIDVLSAYTINDLEPRVATNEGNINILSGEVATFESGLTEEINDRVSGDSIAMDYIESGVGYVIDSLSSTVKNFIEDEYAALSAMVQSLSGEVTELKNLSGTAQSYDDFIAPYNYSDIAGRNLLKRICDALGIEP